MIVLKYTSTYSGPLTNTGLNSAGPLTHEFFSLICITVVQDLWLVESENVEPGKWVPNVKLFRDFSTTGKVSTSNHHTDQGHLYLSFVYSINIFFKTSM